MKNTLLLLLFVLISFVSIAQKGKIQTITPDTLTAVETEYFATNPIGNSWDVLTIQAVFTQLGGTSDGTGILQGSVDGVSYTTLQDLSGIIKGYPNDSVTITNGAIYQWVITKPVFNYYRLSATGTANDTTLVTVKYQYK